METRQAVRGDYAPVNGLDLYYETFGEGTPLILLHGGFGAIEMFGPILPQLAAGRQVIGVDLQAHGRTADTDRPLRIELMADDIAALIRHLNLGQADVMGYSMGGAVALQTAIRHPQVVRKLVVVSMPCRRSGWYPEVVEAMLQMGPEAAEPMKQSPVYQLYAAIAPRVEDWPRLVGKMADQLRQDYDWTQDMAGIQAPTLLVSGDADGFPPQHAAEMFQLLGGGQRDGGWDGSDMSASQLAILPGTTHYNSCDSPLLPAIVTTFLDTPPPTAR